jgi:hypothetical protein
MCEGFVDVVYWERGNRPRGAPASRDDCHFSYEFNVRRRSTNDFVVVQTDGFFATPEGAMAAALLWSETPEAAELIRKAAES